MHFDVSFLYPSFVMAVGMVLGYLFRIVLVRSRGQELEREAKAVMETARSGAANLRKEAELDARNLVLRAREDFEKECLARRQALMESDQRVTQREASLDRRIAVLDRKEAEADATLEKNAQEQAALQGKQADVEQALQAAQAKLHEVAGLSAEDARRQLIQQMETAVQHETAGLIRRQQEEARRTAETQAREIITTAIERFAASQVNSVTVSAIELPSEEMKGRIIGREGRNIRSLETELGVSILIDETPGMVVVSGFDPLRREIARRVLERLIADGRIHPARIEEVAAEVRAEVDDIVQRAGEQALEELKLTNVAPELVRALGQLKFRHSFAQNVLQHSLEMGHLMGMMAADLGLDVAIARRIGLFHDIGKALDHHVEGGHAMIGANLLKRHGEAPLVYNAVASHHREVEGESIYAVLASAADAITAARPGARIETTELYLQRLAQLEAVAARQPGVKSAYAIQAGREVRVIVSPDQVSDADLLVLARNLAQQIEEQVKYSGQIKITVMRETRCVEYAR